MYFNYVTTSTTTQSDDVKSDVSTELDKLQQQRHQLDIQTGQVLEKAFQSNNPDVLLKAQSYWQDIQSRQQSGIKSELIDPNQWNDAIGYKHKAFSLSFTTLRRMAKTPIIKAIITTRQAQVAAFARPQKNKYETGFVIRKKQDYYTNDEVELSAADKKKIKEITEFLLNGGDKANSWHGDTFDSFLKKIVDDALTLDQATFEVVRNRAGIPIEYLAVDGATFRIADSWDDDEYENNPNTSIKREKKYGYYPSYVQVIDGVIKSEFYPWELCFGVRNQTTDIRANGYGKSEVEELISIITWMLYSDSYNGKFFSQGSSPKGLLKVAKGVNRNRLAEFRQQWMSMVAGVENAWKIPVIESEKMEWIDLQKNNTDMQFAKWQEYLIKVACAIFKIAPEEIGFNLGNASGGGALFESNNEQQLKYSKDKGLRPLLRSIEFWINKWLVNPIDENFEFAFVGVDVDDEKSEVDLDISKVGSFMGYKEARRKHGLPEELPDDDLILNPQWIQVYQQSQMADMQGENGEMMQDDMDETSDDDFWDSLDTDDKVEKALSMTEYSDNPMMKDALKILFEK